MVILGMEVSIDGERTRFHFFLYQKLKEILIRYIRIILAASKDTLISKIWRVWLKWAWRAQFLSHTLQILEINLTLEAVKMILVYLIKISFSFWYKKMETSSLSIYRDLHVLEYDWHPWILIQIAMPTYYINQLSMGYI